MSQIPGTGSRKKTKAAQHSPCSRPPAARISRILGIMETSWSNVKFSTDLSNVDTNAVKSYIKAQLQGRKFKTSKLIETFNFWKRSKYHFPNIKTSWNDFSIHEIRCSKSSFTLFAVAFASEAQVTALSAIERQFATSPLRTWTSAWMGASLAALTRKQAWRVQGCSRILRKPESLLVSTGPYSMVPPRAFSVVQFVHLWALSNAVLARIWCPCA